MTEPAPITIIFTPPVAGQVAQLMPGQLSPFTFTPAAELTEEDTVYISRYWQAAWAAKGVSPAPFLIILAKGAKIHELDGEQLRSIGLMRLQ